MLADQKYPPSTTDYTPIMHAVAALNPDIVFVAAYPPDSVGIVRAANEVGLTPKMFGGTFDRAPGYADQGAARTVDERHRQQRSVPAGAALIFPGTEVLAKYRAIAQREHIDPIGWAFPPLGYAAGQVLAEAVEGAKTLDQVKLAAYMRGHTFSTVVGRKVRQGRRMGEVARLLHPVPARHRQYDGPVQGHDARSHRLAE